MYASLLAFEYLSVGYLNLCVVTFSMSGCILYHCSSLLVRWTTDAFKQLVKLGNLGFLYGRFVVIRVASGEAILGLDGMPPGLSNMHSPLFRWQGRKVISCYWWQEWKVMIVGCFDVLLLLAWMVLNEAQTLLWLGMSSCPTLVLQLKQESQLYFILPRHTLDNPRTDVWVKDVLRQWWSMTGLKTLISITSFVTMNECEIVSYLVLHFF